MRARQLRVQQLRNRSRLAQSIKRNDRKTQTIISYPAPLQNTATNDFVATIENHSEIRMRKALARPTYVDDLKVFSVRSAPMSGATPLHCWFNCLRAQNAGLGEVVYGWALWYEKTRSGDVFFSQHHAVLRTPDGLVDITPYQDANKNPVVIPAITFLVDSRVPFDTERGAFPASLVWHSKSGERFWGTRDAIAWTQLDGYATCKFEEENWERYLP